MSSVSTRDEAFALKTGRAPRLSMASRDRLLGQALIFPALAFFALMIIYPLVYTAFLSLHRVNTLTLSRTFIGLDNYIDILSRPEFWTSFKNTLIWTISALTAQIVVGVGVALLLHRKVIFRSMARALILFPYLVPTVIAVLTWQWLFNDLYGYLNYFLVNVGVLSRPISWLSSMPAAMISLVIVGTWKYFPFVVICVLARLQTIPEPLYEAARIDGASSWNLFWDITLPQIRGVLLMVMLLRGIWDFKEFDLPFLLTGGGPQIGTQTLSLLVYREAFGLLDYGKGTAVALIILLFMLTFMFLYYRVARNDEEAGRGS